MLQKDKRAQQRTAQSQLKTRMEEAEDRTRTNHPLLQPLPSLPADFGRGLKLDKTDEFLFKFYTLAFCGGRTLLPKTNAFLNDVTPMASVNPCVKYAILSLAASYVLDYRPSKALQLRAQSHHKKSVLLLGQELNRPETWTPGRGEVAIAVLMLLSHNDLVNWELDRCRSSNPKWFAGYQMGNLVLANTNPGYTYHDPVNVQYSRARRFIGTKAALQVILADVFGPLEFHKSCPHSWLSTGSQISLDKIDGLIGLSPRLLHLYAQITHLASRMSANPNSVVFAQAAKVLWPRLRSHRQWSDLSQGPADLSSLLASCSISPDLDARTGKIQSRTTVVELTAESYTSAAKIYFLCRLLRYPRSHPFVRATLSQLLKCIAYQPTDGILFTAQAPLFSVFVAGAVAVTDEDRKVVNAWFDGVNMSSRGNIPPNRRAMTSLWKWADESLTPLEVVDPGVPKLDPEMEANESWPTCQDPVDDGIAQRRAWWEAMVQILRTTEGRMSLG